MFNYHIHIKKLEDKKEKEKITHIDRVLNLKSDKIKEMRGKNFENRVKNFNYDIIQMQNRANELFEINRNAVKKQLMMRQKLNAEDAEKRMSAGLFQKKNASGLKELLLNSEINKYICNDKKTYFKSIEFVFLKDLFTGIDQQDVLAKKRLLNDKDKKFLEYAHTDPNPPIVDKTIFRNPKFLNKFNFSNNNFDKTTIETLGSLSAGNDNQNIKKKVAFIGVKGNENLIKISSEI